jgi:hypothetical protein
MNLIGLISPMIIRALFILRDTSFIWSPIILAVVLYHLYFFYIRARYIKNLEWVILEVKLPKEILKSPKAMEMVLNAMHQTSDGGVWEIWVKGKVRSWFSLELVSIEGDIHFFIRMEKKYKDLIEAQVYSQYPEVEIKEVEDYTQNVPYAKKGGGDWGIWGIEFAFSKEVAYPIKTYIDYGMDKDPKEEFKVDPMTPVIEYLGSMGPGEQLWIQIPIVASRKRFPKPGTWFGKESWTDQGKRLVEKLMHREVVAGEDLTKAWTKMNISPGEREVATAVERGLSKYGFDCGYRAIYLAKGDKFKGSQIGRLINSIKQYGSQDLNGFKLGWYTSRDEPWQDFRGIILRRWKWRMFDSYRRRSFFYPPYVRPQLVLNTEELATIYHFPGKVSSTPTFKRIESKKGEPPANLPVS